MRLTETSSERSPDPNTAEGGSLAFEMEKELSLARNAGDLLAQVDEALGRLAAGSYGRCDGCGKAIPVARLDALPLHQALRRAARPTTGDPPPPRPRCSPSGSSSPTS